jgi:hypothetical protein
MNTHDRIASDREALAARTAQSLPSATDTARALEGALSRDQGELTMRTHRPSYLAVAGAFAAAAAVLVLPVPTSRTTGWDVSLRSADGRVAVVHLPAIAAADATRRADALAAKAHGTATVTPRTERVWSTVYAMAREALFRIDVSTAGKSDAQVEEEIRAQLAAQGWTPGDVVVERSADGSTVRVGASSDGQSVEVTERSDGEPTNHIAMQVTPFDTTREPGMTDAQLKAKIERQLEARGMKGEVIIDGDRIEIRGEKSETRE